ncbi:hypothetical protein IEQ34_017827 [Dendrobium chrysotoxum]|uniref:Uncharacterized protein n=1 Tax=Dendrobium chrysotoxum TaxID=161865 RepID=A0AAV7GCK8_DENCH|nr:hypothetical protein IEQ34_017827 [Dendrobium chrysotoxum]
MQMLNLDDIHQFVVKLNLSSIFSVGLLDAKHVIQLANDLDYNMVFQEELTILITIKCVS